MMQLSIFNDTPETIRPQKHPRLQWVRICSLGGGGRFHLCCSAMLSCCPAAVLNLDMLSLSCPADHCLPAALPQTDRNFLAGVSSAAPPKLQDSGTSAMQKSIYSQQEGERDRGETETVNGIGAILKLETSRRVMRSHNALLQLFWATLELLWC